MFKEKIIFEFILSLFDNKIRNHLFYFSFWADEMK